LLENRTKGVGRNMFRERGAIERPRPRSINTNKPPFVLSEAG